MPFYYGIINLGDTMSKISNAITLLNLLSTGRKYSIDELSKILEVTPRMVRAYKDELEKSGIYIDSIMGPYGGYVLNQSIRIPGRKFKKEDYELLDKFINNENNNEDIEKLELLKDKIRGIYIGSKNEEKELNLKDDILKKYNSLTRAIKERRKVKILYYSYDKGENERVIRPAEIFLFQDGWYCAAFCELRSEMRHFELKRIRNLTVLEEKY